MLPHRYTFELPTTDSKLFRAKALTWANTFAFACYLDSNGHPASRFDAVLAVGEIGFEADLGTDDVLKGINDKLCSKWHFGFLSYELKNSIERLSSQHPDTIAFPLYHFFEPKYIVEWTAAGIVIYSYDEETSQKVLKSILATDILPNKTTKATVLANLTADKYNTLIENIQQHISNGDVYELNFCQAFFAQTLQLNPVEAFLSLNEQTRSPFAAYYKHLEKHVLCASPERFLLREGARIVSQPIKGTIKRGETLEEDEVLRNTLAASLKDRAENVMIVDLVRNDLTRICEIGSVKVSELFGLYPFRQVWQMISSIEGRLRHNIGFDDILRATFPMGSMTGAPKIMAMELIEKYETTRRGIYSGSIGYVTPDGDFDFNVVIRTLLYDAAQHRAAFEVGGAIVYDSTPESEYEECLLKAKAILELLHTDANSITYDGN